MSKISDSLNHKNIVCPFCSLHCDDLEIDVHDNKLYVKSNVPKSCAYKYEKLNLSKFKDLRLQILSQGKYITVQNVASSKENR